MMNKKGMIIILEAKSFFIPFSKALQKRGTRAGVRVREREGKRREKVSGRENRMRELCEDQLILGEN